MHDRLFDPAGNLPSHKNSRRSPHAPIGSHSLDPVARATPAAELNGEADAKLVPVAAVVRADELNSAAILELRPPLDEEHRRVGL